MLEMTSGAQTKTGKHVTSTVACACSHQKSQEVQSSDWPKLL